MKNKKLIIVGTSLMGEVAKACFEEHTDYQIAGFACHAAYKNSDSVFDHPLYAVEDLPTLCPPETHDVFVAVGYTKMNKVRQGLYNQVKEFGYHCASFIHPSVARWNTALTGDNVFILEGCIVQPFTRIGNNTTLWAGSCLAHHSTIGDHTFVASNAVISGACTIGNNVFIGANATLRDSLNIGDETLIGAGAIIMKDTQPKESYVSQGTKPYPKDSTEIGFYGS